MATARSTEVDLHNPIARQQLLGFDKRTVGDDPSPRRRAVGDHEPHLIRSGQTLAINKFALLSQFLVERNLKGNVGLNSPPAPTRAWGAQGTSGSL